jgi:ELWxxDGT repeat protein
MCEGNEQPGHNEVATMPRPDHAGPPENVIDHLIEVHERNGTLEQLLASGIGDEVAAQLAPLASPVGYMTGKTGGEWQPWVWDGGDTVTLLSSADWGLTFANADAYGGFTAFGGDIYFTAEDPVNGLELRRFDGTTVHLIDLGTGPSEAGRMGGFIEYGGALYFTADGSDGFELHRLDGNGVTLVADINPGGQDSQAGTFGGFIEYDGALYFTADDGDGFELRKYDGSAVTVVEIGAGASRAGSYGGFIEFEGKLYFTALDPVRGHELRQWDGTTLTSFDINDGPGHSFAGQRGGFIEFDGALYFSATDGPDRYQLHKLDANGVSMVQAAKDGGLSSVGQNGFIAFNGDLYFTAVDRDHGSELRRFDGTNIDTIDINPGQAGSLAGSFGGYVEFAGDLYFTALDADGYELRRLNGDTGTVETFDFLPGAGNSEAQPLGVVNGSLAIGVWIDENGDDVRDRYVMLATDARPTSIDDFHVVDTGDGGFEPGQLLHLTDTDLLV